MRLSLTLLGDFQARFGAGPPLRLRTRKTQALLAYLALSPGQPHSRDKLAALLWGDRSQPQARARFRETLFVLRRALAPADPPCLALTGEAVALDAASVDVDAGAFARMARAGDVESLAQAVALYRGDFLEGLAFRGTLFENWLMAERERLRELALEALAKVLAHQRAAGAAGEAVQTALRLIALDPLQETVHRTLMHLYTELGRRGSALQQYQLCVGILATELGVEPEEETRNLYQEILRRSPATSSPEASMGMAPFEPLHQPGRALGSDAPLTGRDVEMARLRSDVAEICRGHGRVVSVVGEAGVGKTRLVGELAAEVLGASRRVLWGRCHESEQILPFAPWLEILKSAQGVADEAWIAALPPAMRRELGRLLPELSRGDNDGEPPPEYLMLFEGVSLLLGHVADRQPIVLILEDLHWADEMSVRLLAFISRRLQAWRLLLLVTAREEELVDAPMLQRTLAELEREPHVDTLALRPLSRADTAGLVRALARTGRDETAVAHLSEQVWRTSAGNPLVVVEAMRAAAHEAVSPGLEGLSLPERVRDIVRRQLDRLDERSRELVALASVVGREFEFALLCRASGADEEAVARAVDALTRRHVLHSVGELLDFTHDRVREAAYGEILAPRRKALHRRVAEALAALHAENLELHHVALGLHYFEGEAWDRAVGHLRRAGARALERFAKREAVACFERALAALGNLPQDRPTLEQAFDVRIELRPALNQLGEIRHVLENLREAEALAEQLNDDRRRGQVCAFMTVALSLLGELDEAVAAGTRAREIAERLGDLKLRILATDILEGAHYSRGDYERVVELAIDNLAVLPAGWVNELFGRFAPTSIYDRVFLVRSLAELGRFNEAAQYEVEAIRLAEPTKRAYSVGMAHWTAGMLHLIKGDWLQARSQIERGIPALRTADAVLALPWAVAQAAWILAQLGETSEAENRLREGEQLVEGLAARDVVGARGACYHALGRACLLHGRLDEARRLVDRAIESSPRHPGDAAHALHLLGDIASRADRFDPEIGEASYREALALAEPRGMRPLITHCHLGLGKLRRRTGQPEQAREHLTIATAMYRAMDMRFWLDQAEAALQDGGERRGV
jgi:DNA-binding SARP family transcriptional activator